MFTNLLIRFKKILESSNYFDQLKNHSNLGLLFFEKIYTKNKNFLKKIALQLIK